MWSGRLQNFSDSRSRLLVIAQAGQFKVRFTQKRPPWRAHGNLQWNSTALNVTNSFLKYHTQVCRITWLTFEVFTFFGGALIVNCPSYQRLGLVVLLYTIYSYRHPASRAFRLLDFGVSRETLHVSTKIFVEHALYVARIQFQTHA